VQCDAVAEALPRLLEGSGRAERQLVRHVETCLRCQAELARYRRMQRLLGRLRAQHPPLPPNALGSVLAAAEERAGQEAVRAALRGRRLVLAAAALLASRGRAARAARVP